LVQFKIFYAYFYFFEVDDTRVVLDSKQVDEKCDFASDYINANFIKSSIDSYYKYIAAQGPTKDTILDFLRMFVQFNIQVVICACNEFESQRVSAFLPTVYTSRFFNDFLFSSSSNAIGIGPRSKNNPTRFMIITQLV
jgi:hypothetical protein